jgi:hypothetical protein
MATNTPEPVSGGASNDSAEAVLRKHLNPALRGKGWDALIAALAVGDQMNWDNAKAAFDQLFKSSASGEYLDRKSGDDGIKRPENIGISDELFRQLSIKVTNGKLTEEVLLEILEVFYGSESLRGHIDSVSEPYNLDDGDDLLFTIDGAPVPAIVFRDQDFSDITQATALEVATAITRQLRVLDSTAFAIPVKDLSTGKAAVRVFSGALGLISSAQVTGGLAQKTLRFESQIQTPPIGTDPSTVTWDLSVPEAGTLRLMISGASAVDLNQLVVGDYVLITGTAFQPENRGSFPITAIDIRYAGATLQQTIDVANDAAVAQGTVTQASLDDVLFFHPVKKAVHNGGTRTVVVSQIDDGQTDLVIPATTQAVNREPGTGAYALDNPSFAATLVRNWATVTATTTDPHGLTVGQQVLIDQAYADGSPVVHAGDGTGLTDSSLGTIWSVVAPPPNAASFATLTKLRDNVALLAGGEDGTPTQTASCHKFMVTSSALNADGSRDYSYAWQVTGSMALARAHHTSSLLSDGSVFVAGGQTGGTTVTNTTERWASDVWASGPALTTARRNHQAQGLNDGTVLIFGGDPGPSTSPLSSTEIYNGTTISAGPSLVTARSNFTSVKLANGSVLAIGGNDITYSSAGGVSRTQITAGVNQTSATPAPVARYVTDYNNQVAQDYLFLSATTSVLVHHDGTTETITPPAVGSGGTWNLTASVGCRVNDSKALVITIYSDLAGAWTFHAWYFDWVNKTFTAATNPTATLSDLGSDLPIPCLMADGRILWIWGPYNGTTHQTPCYIFDPAGAAGAGTWTATGAYPGPFAAPHQLTLLNDGRVLNAGNSTNSFTFDSSTGAWTAHAWGSNTVFYNNYSDLQYAQIKLHDGRVFLAVSGENATIFDPTTNTWTDQPSGTHTTFNGVWAVEYASNKVFVAEAVGGLYYYDLDTSTWTEDTTDFVHPDVAGWLDVGKWAVIDVRDPTPKIDVYSYSAPSSISMPALASCEIYTPAHTLTPTGHRYDASTIALWRLDDDGTDLSGNDQTLTCYDDAAFDLTGVPTVGSSWTTGFGDGGDAFNAVPKLALQGHPTPSVLSAMVNGDFTIKAWVYQRSTGTGGLYVILNGEGFGFGGPDAQQVLAEMGCTSDFHLYCNSWNSGFTAMHLTSSILMPTNTWTHVAYTRASDGAGLWNFRLYINDQLVGSQDHVQGPSNPSAINDPSQQFWTIGGYTGGAGFGNHGGWPDAKIDDVEVESTVNTLSDITADYNAGLASMVAANWAVTGSLGTGRANARAIKLDDGRVLVTGGTNGGADLKTAEIFDPASNRWYPAGKMKAARSSHGMALSKGLVVATGKDTTPEYFDPATGAWRTTPNGIAAGTGTVEAVQLQDGLVLDVSQTLANVLIQANDRISTGGLNGLFRVTGVTSNTFTFETPNFSSWSTSSAIVTPLAAQATPAGFKGPFVLDPDSDVAITSSSSTLAQDLFAGQRYSQIVVADATQFPDEEGYLVIGFGTENATPPLRYFGRVNATTLLLDYQVKMETTNLTGASVTLLDGKAGLSSVDNPQSVGLLYATDSGAGRAAAEEQIQNVIAAGIKLDLEVVYPGDKGLGKNSNPWVWDGEENS